MLDWVAKLSEVANCQINFDSWCIETDTPRACVQRSKFNCLCKYLLHLTSTHFRDILEFEKNLTKTTQKWIFCKNWALPIFKWPNFLQKHYQKIRKEYCFMPEQFLKWSDEKTKNWNFTERSFNGVPIMIILEKNTSVTTLHVDFLNILLSSIQSYWWFSTFGVFLLSICERLLSLYFVVITFSYLSCWLSFLDLFIWKKEEL